MILRILLGIAVVGVGFLLVWKSEWFLYNIGRINWAELKLTGGTRIFYKLAGVILILLGFAIMTNLVNNILLAFVGLFI